MLTLHLATTPADQTGWLRPLRDPVLAPALAAIHASPERKWNLLSLAKVASVSVSLLDERFREVLGLAPIRYLTGWRIHVAKELLRSSDLGVVAVAHRVGYDSEEAFSRASNARPDWPPALGGSPADRQNLDMRADSHGFTGSGLDERHRLDDRGLHLAIRSTARYRAMGRLTKAERDRPDQMGQV